MSKDDDAAQCLYFYAFAYFNPWLSFNCSTELYIGNCYEFQSLIIKHENKAYLLLFFM